MGSIMSNVQLCTVYKKEYINSMTNHIGKVNDIREMYIDNSWIDASVMNLQKLSNITIIRKMTIVIIMIMIMRKMTIVIIIIINAQFLDMCPC